MKNIHRLPQESPLRARGVRRVAMCSLVLGCSLTILTVGCAHSRWNWRETFAMGSTGADEPQLTADSVAGRVAGVEAIHKRASSFDEVEAKRYADSFGHDLASEMATPVKVAIVRCLGDLPTPSAVDSLGVVLRDSDVAVRVEACHAACPD